MVQIYTHVTNEREGRKRRAEEDVGTGVNASSAWGSMRLTCQHEVGEGGGCKATGPRSRGHACRRSNACYAGYSGEEIARSSFRHGSRRASGILATSCRRWRTSCTPSAYGIQAPMQSKRVPPMAEIPAQGACPRRLHYFLFRSPGWLHGRAGETT